jgi:hypothetical protein
MRRKWIALALALLAPALGWAATEGLRCSLPCGDNCPFPCEDCPLSQR